MHRFIFQTQPGHRIATFSRLYFSADDQSLLCTSEDKSLRIWRAPAFAEIDLAEK